MLKCIHAFVHGGIPEDSTAVGGGGEGALFRGIAPWEIQTISKKLWGSDQRTRWLLLMRKLEVKISSHSLFHKSIHGTVE